MNATCPKPIPGVQNIGVLPFSFRALDPSSWKLLLDPSVGGARHRSMTPDSLEESLLEQVAGGNREAFAQFYDRFAPLLFTIAWRILRIREEAEDVVQESFIQIWDHASKYNPSLGKPVAWATTLTRNRSIDRLRNLHRRSGLLNSVAHHAVDPTGSVDPASSSLPRSDESELVRTALNSLTPEYRQAVELAYLRGLTQSEIAEALETPIGTIKARIRRGMLELRRALTHNLGLTDPGRQTASADPP